MGSSYREYMQDRDDEGPTWGHDTPTTKWLIISTLIVFFLQVFMTHRERASDRGGVADLDGASVVQLAAQMMSHGPRSYIEDWFLLDDVQVRRGQIWRLITYVFCHERDNPFNLAFNMVALWYLGSNLERMYGSREILWFYLAAALVCGLAFVGIGFYTPLPLPRIGSTSCIMALFTLYATHFPTREILFCWVVPIQIRVLLLIYAAIDGYSIIHAYHGVVPWSVVAYLSSIWGIAFGYAYRRLDLHLTGFMESFNPQSLRRSIRNMSARRKLKVFQPEPITDLSEEVDAILAKIHEHGSESLTDRERAILQKASEQAKNRL